MSEVMKNSEHDTEERAGFVIFHCKPEKIDPKHPAVLALNGIRQEHVLFPFGFFLRKFGETKMLVAADSTDYKAALKKLLPELSEPQIEERVLLKKMYCVTSDDGCDEDMKDPCPKGTACRRVYGSSSNYYLCACL